MAEVRTRDEAIASVDRAFQAWSTTVTGVLTQAQNAVRVARNDVESIVRKYTNEMAALEALLVAAEDEQPRELQVRALRAKDSLEKSRRASARVSQVEASVARLNRFHTTTATSQVASARAQLSAMSRALEGYRSVGAGHSGGPNGGRNAPVGGGSLVGTELANVDVGSADLDDNPILDDDYSHGTFGKGGLSRADYRWAVQTWNDTVGPGVSAGKTHDDFVERDNRSNARPLRRTADVYDLFLGSDRIRADRRPDGSFDIVNGRHRLLIARELGIKTLPGQVSE